MDKKEFNKTIGENVAYYRHMRGMTLEELGSKIDYSFSYVNYIEKGKNTPSSYVVYQIAKALNVPISKIIGTTEKEFTNKYINDPAFDNENFDEYFIQIKRLFNNNVPIVKIKHMVNLLLER